MKEFPTSKQLCRGSETSGFTILEILVAAALSVVILSVAVGISTSVMRNWNDATSDLNRDAQLRYAEETLRRDLEQGVVTQSTASPWLAIEAQSSGEWSMRWLVQSPDGLSLVEWASLPLDYNGNASDFGFSLFRIFEDNWENAYGAGGALGSVRPSDLRSDWWPPFVVGNIIETEIEVGVTDGEATTVLLSTLSSGAVTFPFAEASLYLKPDYVRVFLRVLSDDKLNEYSTLSGGSLNAAALQLWLDVNTVAVVFQFEILTDAF